MWNGSPQTYSAKSWGLYRVNARVKVGGPCGTRTHDPLRVMQVRYQLRQRPVTDDPTTVNGAAASNGSATEPSPWHDGRHRRIGGTGMETSTVAPDGPDHRTLDLADLAAYAERVRKDGWVIVENAVDTTLADAIYTDLLRLERELGVVPADNTFEGRHTTRIYNLLA